MRWDFKSIHGATLLAGTRCGKRRGTSVIVPVVDAARRPQQYFSWAINPFRLQNRGNLTARCLNSP